MQHIDIAIVGGGPVGAALAVGLEGSGLSVAVLEAQKNSIGRKSDSAFRQACVATPAETATLAHPAQSETPARDPRALALSQGAHLILQRLGAWESLAAHATAIESIHVSQRGGLGSAVLTAQDVDSPALGYVAEYGDLHAALSARMDNCGATILTGARVTAVKATAGYGMVGYQHDGGEQMLTAGLVVLSEGGKSLPAALRQDKDYGQSAVVCTVQTEQPHKQRAFERFTPDGPIALLPLGNDYALVWTTPNAQLEDRLALSDAAFLAQLQSAFGDRQGRFLAASRRAAYPLKLALAAASTSPRIVRIGNAAHTLHPVAGQGFNLGLRDAWKLAETLLDTPRQQLGEAAATRRYEKTRQFDIAGGSLMTDILVESFSNDRFLLKHARGAALLLLDLAPPLKTLFARKMMFGAQAW
jgi:2-octaprenyl-6-methoxyphenol hydroxylase